MTRKFGPDATALRWARVDDDYVEQKSESGVWTTLRTISPVNAVWDGTVMQVSAQAEFTHFIRCAHAGNDLKKSDFLARSIAANLDELYRDDDARALLSEKGFRTLAHRAGPSPMATSGYATRVLVWVATLEYLMPKEGQ